MRSVKEIGENALYMCIEEGAVAPQWQTAGSAGADLATKKAVQLKSMQSVKIETGVRMAIPEGYVGLVFIRSSLGFKRSITLANSVGVIDSDFRGEVCLKLINLGHETVKLEAGERVAQIVLMPCVANVPYQIVSELPETKRGEGGFGSTGTH